MIGSGDGRWRARSVAPGMNTVAFSFAGDLPGHQDYNKVEPFKDKAEKIDGCLR